MSRTAQARFAVLPSEYRDSVRAQLRSAPSAATEAALSAALEPVETALAQSRAVRAYRFDGGVAARWYSRPLRTGGAA